MSKSKTYESCRSKEALEEALDKLIEQAKCENSALKKILDGMDKIKKKELCKKSNRKTN